MSPVGDALCRWVVVIIVRILDCADIHFGAAVVLGVGAESHLVTGIEELIDLQDSSISHIDDYSWSGSVDLETAHIVYAVARACLLGFGS